MNDPVHSMNPSPILVSPMKTPSNTEKEEIMTNSLSSSTRSRRNILSKLVDSNKSSLTSKEKSYLELILSDAIEDELDPVIMALSNRQVFFSPSTSGDVTRNESPGVSPSISHKGDDFKSNFNRSTSPVIFKDNDENHNTLNIQSPDSNDRLPSSTVLLESCVIQISSPNVEIVASSSSDGANILQEYETILEKGPNLNASSSANITINHELDENQQYDSKCPNYFHRNDSFHKGSATRLSRFVERKASQIHGSLWKAHESGLAITQNASQRILTEVPWQNKISLKHRTSVSSIPSLHPGAPIHDESSLVGESKAPPLAAAYPFKRSPPSKRGSMGSFPSIILGTPIYDGASIPFRRSLSRRVSTTSIASLHLGTPINDEASIPFRRSLSRRGSTNSIASIHLGTPIYDEASVRAESFSSLRHPHPLQRCSSSLSQISFATNISEQLSPLDLAFLSTSGSSNNRPFSTSLSSIDALDLARAHPLFEDSTSSLLSAESSFPTLHRARPLKSDSSMTAIPLSTILPKSGCLSRMESSLTVDSEFSSDPSHPLSKLRREAPLMSDLSTIHRPNWSRRRQSSLGSLGDSMTSFPSLHRGDPILNSGFSLSSIRSIHNKRMKRNISHKSINSVAIHSPIKEESSRDSRGETIIPVRDPCHNVPSDVGRVVSFRRGLTHLPSSITLETINSEEMLDTNEDAFSSLLGHEKKHDHTNPIILRRAATFNYSGAGFEAANINDPHTVEIMLNLETVDQARRYRHMMSSLSLSVDDSLCFPFNRGEEYGSLLDSSDIKRSLSESDISPLNHNKIDSKDISEETSWDLKSPHDGNQSFDAWAVLNDEFDEGYGYGHRALSFQIIGTSADDQNSLPHVLSPPLMESLSNFLPMSVYEQNFWMKFSLARDGASLFTLLQMIRGSSHTVLAIETTDGEVFGSFTSTQWRKNYGYFGTGESFLWRMRETRNTPCTSVIDQARLESEIEVYSFTGANEYVQYCTNQRIACGGGQIDFKDEDAPLDDNSYGFGLAIDSDLLTGTSYYSGTFANPPLSNVHKDGSPFEIVNMEVWSFTPFFTEAEAEQSEFRRLFGLQKFQ